jgi:7-cyano-7-deazaguanine synthase in queuosine biosynthesis
MVLQLSGGGLDSISLFLYLKEIGVEFEVLHVNYGQKAFRGERAAVEYFCAKYGVPMFQQGTFIDLFSTHNILLMGEWPTEGDSAEAINKNRLECRNLMLLSYAASLVASKGGGGIYVAYHAEPEHAPFPDAGDPFRKAFNKMLTQATDFPVEVLAPFRLLSREVVFDMGYRRDREYLQRSFTCYESAVETECGKCAHCLKKQSMLKGLGDDVWNSSISKP